MSSSNWACERIVIGGDHAGYTMKVVVEQFLQGVGLTLKDCGAFDEQPSDFPDFAEAVSVEVLSGRADRGILVCGSGVGVSVAANKIPGIRASLCHDTYSARQGVEHDDMNVLCIGARVIGPELAMEIVRAFLQARYTPQPRHARRLDKILDIERRALAGAFGQPATAQTSSQSS
jgi:ribose 5-phosphate isomerase B